MSSASGSPTPILDELIHQLGARSGPLERVIAEWHGPAVGQAATAIDRGAPRERAFEVIEELGRTWGATGDPSWVDGLVAGWPNVRDSGEIDYMFSLYRRPGVYAYARLRGDASEVVSYMKLVLGVVRMPMKA